MRNYSGRPGTGRGHLGLPVLLALLGPARAHFVAAYLPEADDYGRWGTLHSLAAYNGIMGKLYLILTGLLVLCVIIGIWV